jgi:hypothetical protein
VVALKRDWSGGHTLKVAIAMTPRWAAGGKSYPGFVAALYGPLVLALENEANPGTAYLQRTSVGAKPKLIVREGRFFVAGEALQADGSVNKTEFTLVPFAQAKEYRIWLREGAVPKQLPVSLALGARELLSSRDEEFHAALTDEDTKAERRTKPRGKDEFDFFGVEFDAPVRIGKVRFHQGTVDERGGWFAGAPQVEVQREARGPWEAVGPLASYPGSKDAVKAGAAYEAALPQAMEVKAVRVRGRRGGAFTSCTEFEVFP